MYEESGLVRPVISCNENGVGNVLNFSGSDVITTELGAYGHRILGSGSHYVQSSISRYISNPGYYFDVNDDYVQKKVNLILFPFLHKGHWMRTVEGSGGKLSFKPPIYDINAPDLYIPMMAFGTYILLAGFFLGFNGKFSPESLGVQLSTASLCWLLQTLLLVATLHSLGGGGEVPLLDMVAYAGYTFVAASVVVAIRVLGDYMFCAITLWESFCMGVLLVKTMKRILISEIQTFDNNSSKRNYILLFVAAAQIPLLFWLGNVRFES